jgi:hypothetical protein
LNGTPLKAIQPAVKRLNARASTRRGFPWWSIGGVTALSAFLVLQWTQPARAQLTQKLNLFADQFSTSEYYTNNTQLKLKLSGKKATPAGFGKYLVQQLKLETFEPDGARQVTIEAPECLYDFTERTASSAGELKIELGEGRLFVTGEGFLWKQSQSSLIISNRVETRAREFPKMK